MIPTENKNRRPNPATKPKDHIPGFFRQNGLIMAVSALGGGVIAWWLVTTALGPKPSASKPQEVSMVRIALPPPPSPTPPPFQPKEEAPTPPPDQQQMIDQAPVSNDEQKKPEAPDKAPEEAAPMGTNIQGNGPADAFGLVGRGNGGIVGGRGAGSGNGGGGSSRWGWYAAQVQSTVAAALGKNTKTRTTTPNISVRIWPDANGRIERAELVDSTGDRTLDDAIKKEVLTGLMLREPPPAEMPKPIVLRLIGKRPDQSASNQP